MSANAGAGAGAGAAPAFESAASRAVAECAVQLCPTVTLHLCLPVYRRGSTYLVRLTELALVAWPVADYLRFQNKVSNASWTKVYNALRGKSPNCCVHAEAPGAPSWLGRVQSEAFGVTTVSTHERSSRPIQKDYFVTILDGLTAFVKLAGPLSAFVHRPIGKKSKGEAEAPEAAQLRANAHANMLTVLGSALVLHTLGEDSVKRCACHSNYSHRAPAHCPSVPLTLRAASATATRNDCVRSLKPRSPMTVVQWLVVGLLVMVARVVVVLLRRNWRLGRRSSPRPPRDSTPAPIV